MSIVNRVNRDNIEYPEMILMEANLAESLVSRVLAFDDDSATHAFCHILLCLRDAAESGESKRKILETINLLLELAFLESKQYDDSFSHYVKWLEGEIMPDAPLVFDFSSKPEAGTVSPVCEQEESNHVEKH